MLPISLAAKSAIAESRPFRKNESASKRTYMGVGHSDPLGGRRWFCCGKLSCVHPDPRRIHPGLISKNIAREIVRGLSKRRLH